MHARGGFTLIELILVTVIIGILAGAVVLNFGGRQTDAMIARAKADIVTYTKAVDLYAIDNNDKYPSSLNALRGGKRDYVKAIANDPWGHPYIYEQKGGSYSIYSRGPDEQANTEDDVTVYE